MRYRLILWCIKDIVYNARMKFIHIAVFCSAIFTVSGLRPNVDVAWMEQTLRGHFSSARHHVTGKQYKDQSMQFIFQYFQSLGLETKFNNFSTAVNGVIGKNVIGILKGQNYGKPTDIIYAIGAHYDTMRNTPGVNDNGGSVVAMLQAAKILEQMGSRNSSMFFVAFDFEEWEQNVTDIACTAISCGSRHFISTWLSSYLSKSGSHIGGFYILDTVMNYQSQPNTQSSLKGLDQFFPDVYSQIQSHDFKGDFLFVIARNVDTNLTDVFITGWNTTTQPKFRTIVLNLPIPLNATQSDADMYYEFFRSDQGPLWLHGYNAIFLTDTGNFRGYMEACYHQRCDNVTESITPIKMQFLAQTTNSLVETLNTLSPVTGQVSGTDVKCPCATINMVFLIMFFFLQY